MRNIFKLLKIYRRASTIINLMEDARVNKKLYKSKTFWFQVLSAAAALSGVIPLPPEILAVIVGVINVRLRLVTAEPVSAV